MDTKTVTEIGAICTCAQFYNHVACNKHLYGEMSLGNVPNSPPPSPEHALLYRRIALHIKEGWGEPQTRARWQNYWLSCCLSSKCDYIFNVLAAHNIDREEDIFAVLGEDSFWNHYVDSKEGKSYYIKACLSFLLRRFSYCRACYLWWKYKPSAIRFGLVSLCLPRLFGAIIIGVILTATSPAFWELPTRILKTSDCGWVLLLVMVVAAFGYLVYDCRKKTEYKSGDLQLPKLLKRTAPIIFVGGIESFVINYFIVIQFFKSAFETKPSLLQISPNFWVTCSSFTVEALFIGIFMQSFWEEKSIAEPL